ncbi:MAG: hypothetical protein OEM64_05655 [Gammaproteobacteria bacterium]|nr:hypothetical protein [Gammaproteobacteria bacterium]
MMRQLLALFLILGISGIAAAHTLDDKDGLVTQLYHQVLGSHHLPLTMLLIVGGVVLLWRWQKVRRQ